MSWFSLENEFNSLECQKFRNNARTNKGKFIKFYDDITDKELTEQEIKLIEENRDSHVPIIAEFDDGIKEYKPIKTSRKYKSRLPINPQLRKAVLELYNKQCSECEKVDSNIIHHKDEDPSNNNINNLQLLCYDCHLKKHKKKIVVEE